MDSRLTEAVLSTIVLPINHWFYEYFPLRSWAIHTDMKSNAVLQNNQTHHNSGVCHHPFAGSEVSGLDGGCGPDNAAGGRRSHRVSQREPSPTGAPGVRSGPGIAESSLGQDGTDPGSGCEARACAGSAARRPTESPIAAVSPMAHAGELRKVFRSV